ncbi:unnamed protein product [Peronospora destructor]|uniref:Uncharacterized protein n=1 Tax=Peronospora destructor TaxID=86335 RepID=A0AAV0UWN1_9STRA|nr:unnamed protein product [Peronospora destructor]
MQWRLGTNKGVRDRFTNPFAPLLLSLEAIVELETLTRSLVTRNFDSYERYLGDNSDQVDRTRWKFMYEQEGLRSYSKRSTSPSFSFGAALELQWGIWIDESR